MLSKVDQSVLRKDKPTTTKIPYNELLFLKMFEPFIKENYKHT